MDQIDTITGLGVKTIDNVLEVFEFSDGGVLYKLYQDQHNDEEVKELIDELFDNIKQF